MKFRVDISLGVVAKKLGNVSPVMSYLNPKLEELRLRNGESKVRLSKISLTLLHLGVTSF